MDAPTCITTKFDEVDKLWEMGLDDYENDDKESLVGDEINHADRGPTHKGGPIDEANLVANVSSKPNFPEPVNANSSNCECQFQVF